MKIMLKAQASIGDLQIPAGEYFVGIQTDTREITLTGHGQNYRVPAIKRPSKAKNRVTDVQLYSMGGPTWTLLVKTPPQGEYVAFVKYEKDDDKR